MSSQKTQGSLTPELWAEILNGKLPQRRRWRWNGLWRRGAGTWDPYDPDNGRLIFHWLGITAWLYCRHFKTWRATIHGMYWWIIRRYKAELCQDCGGPVRIVYHAPDDLWETATGLARRPDGESAPGILCPSCFADRVSAKVRGYVSWTCEVVSR